MKTKIFTCLIFSLCLFISACNKDKTSPKVISTFPESGAQNVDPQTTEIWVKFNEPMMDKSWSWTYRDKTKFPDMSGEPRYSEDYTKNILPVHLQPDQEYSIWINNASFLNFKDKDGNSSEPFELKFKTK